MIKFCFLFLFVPTLFSAQILFSEQTIDMGKIEEAYEIKGDVVLTNTSAKKIFLMRADADRGVKIYTSKKTLLAGDTCLLVISFIPENKGKFKKKIQLVTTDKETPYEINLSGNLIHLKTNDLTACVYFGKRRPNSSTINTNPIRVPEENKPRDISNKIPDTSETPLVTTTAEPVRTNEKENPVQQPIKNTAAPEDEFSEVNYKPNNIIFLVDISSSMRDSLKLPLMKTALHKLIDAVRKIDTITFVTYAYQVKVIQEAVSGAEKNTLHVLVDSLKAKGMTAGKTAILFSQLLAQKHYIADGNNQIIIATDGEFKFEKQDFQTWKKRQSNKRITMSTVAFGTDKAALKNLRDLASKGDGSFIHIYQKEGSEHKIVEEIKLRSRRQ